MPGVAQRVGRGIALLFHDLGTRRGEGSAARPGRTLLSGKTRYPLYRRLGGPKGRSGQARKISPPPAFDPRNVQPVVSHYTYWATRPTLVHLVSFIIIKKHMEGFRNYRISRARRIPWFWPSVLSPRTPGRSTLLGVQRMPRALRRS
jgi:hypothetical protein